MKNKCKLKNKYWLKLMRVNASIWWFRVNFKLILPNNLNKKT